MRRRDFIGMIGGAGLWPLLAHAGRADGLRRVGVLMAQVSESDPAGQARFKLFVQQLQKLGWTHGRDVLIEARWSGADPERIQKFAKELVAQQPDVIVTTSTPSTAAVQRETRTIPTVFVGVSDPVGEGFVAGLAQPNGNITGFINYEDLIAGKWIELLKEIDPRIEKAAMLFNPETASRGGTFFLRPFEAAAGALTITPLATPIRGDADIEAAILAIARERGGGLVMMADSYMAVHRTGLIELAARHRVPAIYPFRAACTEGGLLSYGPDLSVLFSQVGPYVDRILKGEKPNELPVQVPTKFELVINQRTAKALGLDVSAALLGRADEVIE